MDLRVLNQPGNLLVLTCITATILFSQTHGYCDRLFLSEQAKVETAASWLDDGPNNGKPDEISRIASSGRPGGSFEAPSRIKAKSYSLHSTGEQGKSILSRITSLTPVSGSNSSLAAPNNGTQPAARRAMHCLYKFIAGEDERISLSFTSFRLRGSEPECNHEYVDIYVRFKSTDLDQGDNKGNLEAAMGRELPNGRFCTTIVPRKLVSQHNVIVLSIYSDLEPPPDNRPIFKGTYEFAKTKTLELMGPPREGTLCNHTILSSARREGEFQSITYPGVYVKNMRCSYKFLGEPGQRIRLEFLDLDLYSGGPHCPFDSVKIFDGSQETDPIIQTICGSHRSLIIFSTHHELLVTFTTLQRESEVQDRGFSAYFEFNDKFYNPSFIQYPNARHIRGSECDQRIVSTKGSSGLVVSPAAELKSVSANHSNAICRYFFEGLQSSHDYEKVLLKFVEFDLHGSQPDANLTNSNSQNNATAPDQCPDNYVRLYTSDQKPDQKQDPNDYDYVFCGREVPPTIESDAASLMMEYNSGTVGGLFRAEYTFIVDFRIPGSQASSSACDYVYRSDISKTGSFNSPRHPSWYINDMNCTFTFLTRPDEALLLQFTNFKMSKSFGENVVGYNDICKGEDSVKIKEMATSAERSDQYEVGTYCGSTTPGPILNFRPVQIEFKTNKEQVNYGFNAIYHFHTLPELRTNEFVSNCGETLHASHKLKTGNFSSPPTYRSETYEKRNHICSWNITARSGHRIALDFDRFELEGSPPVRGCATAAVRLEFNRSKPPVELCGTLPAANGTGHQYISEDERLVVSFISTKQASGSNGFMATWTEIKRLV